MCITNLHNHNDATSQVTVGLMIETPNTLHTHGRTTLYISSGHTDAIPSSLISAPMGPESGSPLGVEGGVSVGTYD